MADATRVLLAPHDPAWAEMAAAEGARLAGVGGEHAAVDGDGDSRHRGEACG